VFARYGAAARQVEPALCCAVPYRPEWLAAIPAEILARDYGCGDPTVHVRPGETVVDLGSGAGKACYILAQVVGAAGRVVGVDAHPEMLALARRHRAEVAQRLGYANVEFRRGLIQDLALDLDLLAGELANSPVATADDWLRLRDVERVLRRDRPLIPDASVDCVVSNCVLNLVRNEDRRQLFSEIFRVLKPGGRAAISDIVGDRDVPESLRRDPELWSGCISGAFREDRFLRAFSDAGFHGMHFSNWASTPWQVVEGIAFRSVTLVAFKPAPAPADGAERTVIYRGPFASVQDDAGQSFARGERTPVSGGTFDRLAREPYANLFAAPGGENATQRGDGCGGTSCC
jgi:SAM-dependent methyltransferase